MYPGTKLQILGPVAPKNISENFFKKINIKFEARIRQCMSVPDFSQFGELQFLRPNLPKKTFRIEYLDKCMQPENNLF